MTGALFASVVAFFAVGTGLAPAQDRALVVGTRQVAPFAMRDADGSWSGISVDLWQAIAADLDLEFEFRELELDGLVEGLANGSLDVGVAALTVTERRATRFDFSHPYYSSGLGIAVAGQPATGLLSILRSFPFGALLRALVALLGAIWIAGAVIWVFEHRRNPEQFGGGVLRGMGEAFWWSAVTMTTVGYGDKAPRTPGGRLFALIWMFTSVVVISGFTAAIASTLTVGRLQTDIQNPRDLKRDTTATVAGTTSETWLERHGIRTRAFPSVEAGLEAVASGELTAAVYDAPILRHLAVSEFEGRIQVLPFLLDHQNYAFGLKPESALRKPLNRALLHQTESISWSALLQRYLGAPGA